MAQPTDNPTAERPTRWGLESSSIPLPCLVMVVAATCIWIGITWDISWHQTIGRDTFWTPAHMVIYLGGLLAGGCGGWLILQASFGSEQGARSGSVKVWKLHGPLGAWVAVWAALAMMVSAPLDDWWHNAYGLDVTILSPPHALLAAGMHHVEVGALLLMASLQNRMAATGRPIGRKLFVYTGAVMLALATLLLYELSLPNQQRSAVFYQASAALYPVLLVAVARASTLRWAATWTTLIYTGLKLAIMWILPMFPATPMLAPIYNPVDHMVPSAFPLLLVIPALAVDLLFWWLGKGRSWWREVVLTLLISVAFVGLFLASQWWFSKFLLSPAADNWFFAGNRYWSYFAPEGDFRTRFWNTSPHPVSWAVQKWALLWAVLSTAMGLGWGFFMSRVKR